MPAVAELDSPAEHDGGRGLTFFEVTTAMGLVHFARRGAELVVLEVGMGGRLDSTNTVRPLVSVITSISLDHMRQLGNTLGLIAREKAGIIKRGRPVVSGVREAEPAAVIAEVARERRVPLRAIGRDFTLAFEPPRAPLERPEAGRFRTRTWARDWGDRPVPLYGPHQALNAAVALATLDVMAEAGMSIGPEAVARGWERLNYPARFEILGEGPWLVIDGAHNEASAQALAETLRQCAPDVPRTLVFGTTREKDLEGQVRALGPLCAQAVATCYLENPRAVPVDEVAEALGRHVAGPVHAASSPAQALAIARRVTPAEGLICVTGSLFLAAECRAIVLGLDEAPALGVGQGGRG
jgi:dihydrofolate synthase/folylpolyglutamate synthase